MWSNTRCLVSLVEVQNFGVKMTKQIKKIGCSNIKTLVESDKIVINDFNIIEEMSTFIRRGQSWQASKRVIQTI